MNRALSRQLTGVVATLLAAGGLGAAEPPRPVPPQPLPATAPVVLPPSTVTQGWPASLPAFLPAEVTQTDPTTVPAADRQVLVRAVFIVVPPGYGETLGLVADAKTKAHVWPLTPREAKMLVALIKANKAACAECGVLSAPQLLLTNEQTGFFEVGQPYEVLGPLAMTEENGEKVVKAKMVQLTAGITLRATPTLAADGKAVSMKVETQYSCIAGMKWTSLPATKADGSVEQVSLRVKDDHAKSRTVPRDVTIGPAAVDTNTLAANLKLSHGETVVIGGLASAEGKSPGEKPDEVLVILQAAVVGPPKK